MAKPKGPFFMPIPGEPPPKDYKCYVCKDTGKCPDCNGTRKCNVCSGTGRGVEVCKLCWGTGMVETMEGVKRDCERCHGTGKAACPICLGTGKCTSCKGSGKCYGRKCIKWEF